MSAYDVFAEYYDIFWDWKDLFSKIMDGLQGKYGFKTEKVLEIACGTGKNLEYFTDSTLLAGVDISARMLDKARVNVPAGQFHYANMTEFNLGDKFDLILCVYDSLNHLLEFSEWEQVFVRVSAHLEAGGYFVFDVNTPFKLNFAQKPRFITQQYQKDYLIMKYVNCEVNKAEWDLTFMVNTVDEQYEARRVKIVENSFENEQIREALLKQFSSVEMLNDKLEELGETEYRVYFICRK